MAGFFDTLFGGGAEREAADKNRALYNQYQGQGTGYLNTGYDTGVTNLNKALDAYTPLSDLAGKYRTGSDLYLDALGVNGAAGNSRATGAFQAGPGYQFTLDQGLDALNRRRAAAGMVNSGNADIDALKFGTGLANQEFGSWLDRLNGVNSNALTATSGAASGQAGAYGGLADLARSNATDQIGLLGNTTSGLASANNTQAAGEAAGAKNLLGAGLSLATLAAGGGGLSGLGSSLGNLTSKLGAGKLLFGGGSPSGY